jgi:uncharacterized protein (TIGR00661 family)
MRKIFVSLSSGGLGHVSRTLALLPGLAARHEVHVGAQGGALAMLRRAAKVADLPVELHPIPSLAYRFRDDGRLDFFRTFIVGYGRLYRHGRIAECITLLDRIGAEAVVSDFDPFMAWAAERSGRPYIYCAAAYFFSHFRDHFQALGDRRQATVLAQLTNLFFPRKEAATVIPTFRTAGRVARGRRRVTKPPSVINSALLAAPVETRRHLLAYLGGDYHAGLLPHLREAGVPVLVYGFGDRESEGNLTFKRFHPIRYAESMASARALVTPAGHQSLSEVLYLGKPSLSVPLRGSWEQQLNAKLFARLRPGAVADFAEVDAARIRALLDAPSDGLQRIEAGNDAVVDTLVDELARV